MTWLFEPVLADTPAGRFALALLATGWVYLGMRLVPKLLGLNGKLSAMTMKTYGGGNQVQQLDEPYEFRLVGTRFDEEEVHEFTATRKPDTLLAGRFMNMGEEQGGELLRLVTLLIGKTLNNKDGVPVQWSPEQLVKPRDAGDDWEPKFRGPDGELYPMAERVKFEEYSAGSSRRRWQALLVDNEFTVEMEVLVEITKDMIEGTAGTPTDG